MIYNLNTLRNLTLSTNRGKINSISLYRIINIQKKKGKIYNHKFILGIILTLFYIVLFSVPSNADLKLCNSTQSRIGVSIGYQDKLGWATEGWWNIASQACETLLKGPVPNRFIYVHAIDYDRTSEKWEGKHKMCTTKIEAFLIRGVSNCSERGYITSGFFEVDTEDSLEWTIRLSESGTKSKKSGD